jgi:hypothetical protein
MERTLVTLPGSSQAMLVDRDIAHLGRVMRPSLHADLGGPILPVTYWRKRLYQLLDSGNLSRAQLCTVDSLLLQLDEFASEPVWNATGPAAARSQQPPGHHFAPASHPA